MTQTAKHTPGPWEAENYNDTYSTYRIEQAARREKCGFISAEEKQAKPRLIAAAAGFVSVYLTDHEIHSI